MPLPPLSPLLLFMAMALISCMFLLVAAGHFPAHARAPTLRTPSGAIILWGSICVVIASALGALYFAFATLPWYAAVIGGGLMVLAAPLLVQPFPNHIVDGKAALLALSALTLALDFAALRLL